MKGIIALSYRSAVSQVLILLLLSVGIASATTEKVLHSFGSGSDGVSPFSGLSFDANGNLYGTASNGGGRGCGGDGCGIVFQLTPASGGDWDYNVLHSFSNSEGGNPYSTIAIGPHGYLYGTTLYWGQNHCGSVFSLAPAGGSWAETALHQFTCGNDGFSSYGVTFDSAGHLFGTAYAGGPSNHGVVFNLRQQSVFGWSEVVLHGFNGNDGNAPSGNLTFDAAGNIYGTTYEGSSGLTGLVFKLSQGGAGWRETVLYTFHGTGFSAGPDGVNPVAGVVFDSAGNLYGTADYGGPANLGAVFKLTPNSDGTWTESVLYAFRGGADGGHPYGGVIVGQDGNLYGTTQGGAGSHGTVYKLSQGSGGQWTETILYTFQGGNDGSTPYGGLVSDSAGNLFGTTAFGGQYGGGVVFEIPAN